MGGGLTGLALAHLLGENDIDALVIEKEAQCGGLMRSLYEEGFTFDPGGSHVIFSNDRDALEFMLGLLGGNKVRRRRNTKILYKGRFVKYPFENGLCELPKNENYECLSGFVSNLIKRECGKLRNPRNLKEWCTFVFGNGIAEKYLLPYNAKIWKVPLESMALDWIERVPNPPVDDILKSAIGIRTEGYTHQLHFFYPRLGGIQAIIRELERRIGDERIMRATRIREIRKEGKSWIVSIGKNELEFDRMVSTIPLQELAQLLRGMPGPVKESIRNLRFNSLVTLSIGLKRKKLNRLSWIYLPSEEVLPHRVSFPSNFSPCTVPNGCSSLLAEITCQFGGRLWKTSDRQLTSRVVEDLEKSKLISREDVIYASVNRTKYAYVVDDKDCSRNVAVASGYLSRTGVRQLGRFSQFEYLNMDGCIRRAIDFAASEVRDAK